MQGIPTEIVFLADPLAGLSSGSTAVYASKRLLPMLESLQTKGVG